MKAAGLSKLVLTRRHIPPTELFLKLRWYVLRHCGLDVSVAFEVPHHFIYTPKVTGMEWAIGQQRIVPYVRDMPSEYNLRIEVTAVPVT